MSTHSLRGVEEKLYQNRYLVDAGKPHIPFDRTTSRPKICSA